MVVLLSNDLSVDAQKIKAGGKQFAVPPNPETKMTMQTDSLSGRWLLVKNIQHQNGDTIIREPSMQLWKTPGAKPITLLILDSFKNFKIEQECMKCPLLKWTGKYRVEIKSHNEKELFYLVFTDQRQYGNNTGKSLTAEFNGYLTKLEKGELQLTDDKGDDWVYKRLTE